jgi:arylsulfatase A-like enzyme
MILGSRGLGSSRMNAHPVRSKIVGPKHALGSLLLSVVLSGLLLSGCTPEKEVSGIVLISIDTLRADHLGCYGYPRETSPFLDQLAARGARFEQAISPSSWTLPSHASMLTGLYPSSHRAVDAASSIAPSAVTVAELLRGEGFATGAVVTSWFVSANYGFDRGFDWFQDLDQTAHEKAGKTVDAREVVDLAEEWLEARADQRFFLFLHLYDTHYTYNPPPPYRELFATDYKGPRRKYRRYKYYKRSPPTAERLAFEMSMYDGEIRYVDDQLARLYGILDRLGLQENTLIIVTSDHGEEFGERGSWGHGHTLFEEQVHVPLLVAGPGIEGPQTIAAQVGLVDLPPTLLELVDLSPPEGLHGRSLAPLLRGQVTDSRSSAADGRPALLDTSRFDTNLIGLRRRGWKLLLDLGTGRESLFDLSTDPGETQNLASDRTDIAARLRTQTMSAVEALAPDRWNLAWLGESAGELIGELETRGVFLEPSPDGGAGTARVSEDLHQMTFQLSPNETLRWKMLPVDAGITITSTPVSNGTPVPLLIGEATEPVQIFPHDVSIRDASAAKVARRPELPAAHLWIESQQDASESVDMRRADRRRLKALGYIVD